MIHHNLPSSWRWVKLKFLSRIRYGLGQPPAEMDGGLPLLRATNIDHGRITTTGMIYVDPTAVLPDRDAFLRRDEILVVRSGAYTGDSAIVPTDYEGAVAGYDMVVRVVEALPKYIAYGLLSISVLKNQIDLCRMRAAQPHLNAEDLGDCLFAVPPVSEQRAIAVFLDRKTAEIDAVIAKKERLIALLQEERQALISRAVTRGLDAGAAMKDSGIPWLGEVPTHWDVQRLKFSLTMLEQGWSPQCDNRQAEEDEWGVLKVGCVNGNEFDPSEQKALPLDVLPEVRYEIQAGDILMSRGNTRELVGSAALVQEVLPRLLLCDLLYRLRVRQELVDPAFVVYQLRSPSVRFQIEREASGTSASMKKIGQETISDFIVCLPDLAEQRQIVSHIRKKTNVIDSVLSKNADQITKLREYRQALISAAVTGKLAVPQEVAT